MVTQLAPLLACLLVILLWFEETPLDLILKNNPQDALSGLQRVANINGRNFDITPAEVI